MKFCPNCGQSLPDDAGFCGNCGAALPNEPAQSAGLSVPPAPAVPAAVAYCPSCGGQVEADAEFCPNCGAAMPKGGGKGPKAPMSKNAKVGIIAVACAAAVIALAVLLLPSLFSSPGKDFVKIQAEFLAGRLLDPLQTVLESGTSAVPKGFSTDMTISASVDSSMIDKYLEDSSIKLRLDAQKDTVLADGEFNLMGSTVLSGAATYEKGVVGFALPQVDNNYYVLDLAALIEEQTGTKMDLDSLTMPEIDLGEWFTLAKDYGGIISEAMTKDNLTLEKGREVKFEQLKGSFKGNVYTFKPKADDIENMLLKLADKIEEDATLRKLIADSGLSLTGGSLALSRSYGYGYGYDAMDADNIDEMLRDLADEIRDNAEDIADEIKSAKFTWTLATEGRQVRRIELKAGGMVILGYECSGSESKGQEEVLYMENGSLVMALENEYTKKGGDIDGKMELSYGSLQFGKASYERSGKEFKYKGEFGDGYQTYCTFSLSGDSKDSKGRFEFTAGDRTSVTGDFTGKGSQVEGELVISDGYESMSLEMDVDTAKQSPLGLYYGDYSFNVPDTSVQIDLEVKEGKSGSADHVVTVRGDAYELSGGAFSRIDITVNATEKSTVKKPGGKKVDITDYDLDELEELFTDIGEQLEDDLEDIMYELYFTYGF